MNRTKDKSRSRRKAARAAAEAREDAEDQRVVERHLADLRAGRVRTISWDEMALRLGGEPFKDRLKKPRPYPVYDFGFWEVRTPPARWCCHALALPGILGIGGTAARGQGQPVCAAGAAGEMHEGAGRA